MMNTSLRDEVSRVFRDSNYVLDDKLISECVSICQMYVITAEALRFKLEAINYKSTPTLSEISPITMDSLSIAKTQIQQDLAKSSSSKPQTKTRNLGTAQVDRSRLPPFLLGGSRGIPAPQSTQIGGPVKQEQSLVTSIGNLSGVSRSSNLTFIGPSMSPEAKRKRAYHYMYEKISERSESLDQIIDDFADLIRGHYDITDLGDPAASTDEEVTIVGRITHDAESASMSKLSEGAICIESSRILSSGARVPLLLDPAIKIRSCVRGVGGVGIYPGAIVALKGKNGGGGYFLATEFLGIPPLKPSPASQGIMNPKLDPLAAVQTATMIVACGPYTMDTDIGFKPWRALLQHVKTQKPDVLLLIGPFVDIAHPKIKSGDLDVPSSSLFRANFVDPLRAYLTISPESIVLIVPSVRDLASNHAAFPQPEFDAELFNAHPRIHLLPNPTRFSINDISFGVTSVDTLFHLRKEEYFKRGTEYSPLPETVTDLPNDAMANLCRHLLLQRSFYPIFPPPAELSFEINLDLSHFDNIRIVDEEDLDYAPDIMILPSRLKQFAKTIHSTTTLNPSFLSKGTYGAITIAPPSAGTPASRLTVEVARLEALQASTTPSTSAMTPAIR